MTASVVLQVRVKNTFFDVGEEVDVETASSRKNRRIKTCPESVITTPEFKEQLSFSLVIPSNPRRTAPAGSVALNASVADEKICMSQYPPEFGADQLNKPSQCTALLAVEERHESVDSTQLPCETTGSTKQVDAPTSAELSVLHCLLSGNHSPLHSPERDSSPPCALLTKLMPDVASTNMMPNLLVETTVSSVLSIINKTAEGSRDEGSTRQLELASFSPSMAPMPRQCLDSWLSEELPTPCGGENALPSANLESMQDPFALRSQPALEPHAFDEANTGDMANGVVQLQGSKKTQKSRSKHWCHFHLGEDMIAKRGFELNKKIIGRGGCNMKAIFDATGAKVRLRGRGSGHLEGGREAPVPLMLAVTCIGSVSTFRTAIKMAVEVLRRVEAQFHATCGGEEQLPCFKVASLSPGALECLDDVLCSVPTAPSLPRLLQMQ